MIGANLAVTRSLREKEGCISVDPPGPNAWMRRLSESEIVRSLCLQPADLPSEDAHTRMRASGPGKAVSDGIWPSELNSGRNQCTLAPMGSVGGVQWEISSRRLR
jgi:hypothetical protein